MGPIRYSDTGKVPITFQYDTNYIGFKTFQNIHIAEKALFVSAEKPEKDRDRNMSLASCSSESTTGLTECGAADADDCTSSDRTITAGQAHHAPCIFTCMMSDTISITDIQYRLYAHRAPQHPQQLTRAVSIASPRCKRPNISTCCIHIHSFDEIVFSFLV